MLSKGVDIIVGTTGRILDLLERKHLSLQKIKLMVLDEADRMLNMGFEEDVEKIVKIIKTSVKKLQFLIFSATLPEWVRSIIDKYLNSSYKTVDLVQNLVNKTASTVKHLAINCPYVNRTPVLADISKLI